MNKLFSPSWFVVQTLYSFGYVAGSKLMLTDVRILLSASHDIRCYPLSVIRSPVSVILISLLSTNISQSHSTRMRLNFCHCNWFISRCCVHIEGYFLVAYKSILSVIIWRFVLLFNFCKLPVTLLVFQQYLVGILVFAISCNSTDVTRFG